MGRRATGSVFPQGEVIRCQFQWQGERVSETFHGLSPLKPRDMAIAKRMMVDIIEKIGHGVFDYAGTFPDSPRAAVSETGTRTLGQALDQFLANKSHMAQRTRDQYRNAADEWREVFGNDLVLSRAVFSEFQKKINKPWPDPDPDTPWKWSSEARFNNAMIPMRGAIELARADNPKLPDLLKGIDYRKKDDPKPDPVRPAEMGRILAHIRSAYGDRPWAWFAFAFSTGLRPSEQCVLLQSDIQNGRVEVSKSQDKDGSLKPTKANGTRFVDMSPLAIEAVRVASAWTHDGGEIFQNPRTDKPWRGNKSQYEHFWTPTLKKLDISRRRAYCTRHTFATTLLAHGARIAYVSDQMGHTTPSMIEKTYHRWLHDADGGAAKKILEGAFG
jgi:integrase